MPTTSRTTVAAAAAAAAALSSKVRGRLVWHRGRDLRLRDNELYHNHHYPSSSSSEHHQDYEINNNDDSPPRLQVISCFICNPKDFVPRQRRLLHDSHSTSQKSLYYESSKYGPHICRVLCGALSDLQRQLPPRSLIVRHGDPFVILPQLIRDKQQQLPFAIDEICWSEDPGYDEQQESERLRDWFRIHMPEVQVRVVPSSCTLYHIDDLPLGGAEWSSCLSKKNKKVQPNRPSRDHRAPRTSHGVILLPSPERLAGMPRIMGNFRKAAAIASPTIRSCWETPLSQTTNHVDFMELSHDLDIGRIPTVEELLRPMRTWVDQHYYPEQKTSSTDKDDHDGVLTSATTATTTTTTMLGLPSRQLLERVMDAACSLPLVGGETEGLARLEEFTSTHAEHAQRHLADTISCNDSSRFSLYLAVGSLSPRQVFHAAAQDKKDDIVDSTLTWIQSHMTMRDFFLLECYRQGKDFYRQEGNPVHGGSGNANNSSRRRRRKKQKQKNVAPTFVSNNGNGNDSSNHHHDGVSNAWRSPLLLDHAHEFERWASGLTGFPLIDAGMRELLATGYCSNRVRQNMASFLAKDLKLDWRFGAGWFQFCLADHCVGANYGNWQYFSGVGADPKQRHFRSVSQAQKYDPDGHYVRKWVAELVDAKGGGDGGGGADDEVFCPWKYRSDWSTMVDPSTQISWIATNSATAK